MPSLHAQDQVSTSFDHFMGSTIDSPMAGYLNSSDMGMGASWVATLFLAPNQILKLNGFGFNKNFKSMRQWDKVGWQPLLLSKLSKQEGIKKIQEVPRSLQRFRCNHIHS